MAEPSQFYWSQQNIPYFGRMWFPLVLQRASHQGAGERFLGSIVEENWYGPFNKYSYPSPYLMTTPEIILDALNSRRELLSLKDEIVLEADLDVPSYTMESSDVMQAGLSIFPALPASFKLSVNYSEMERITVEFGGTTKSRYIPTDYLVRLYKKLDGDAKKIDPNVGISIAKNYIVDQVLIADQFSVIFESKSDFTGEFEAKLNFQNTLPENEGKISVQKENSKRIVAQIQNGPSYLVAFKVIEWEDLG